MSDAPRLLVNIDVDDLAKAEAFYCAALHLRVGRRFGDGATELLGGSVPIHLLQNDAGTPATPAANTLRTYERHWTPVHLDVEVPEVEAAVERAIGAGARLEGEIRTRRWGRLATLADPFGHGICFVQFLGRGYDEIADPS